MNGETHPAFHDLALRFGRLYGPPGKGGGALAAYLHGEPVVDVWAGYADPGTARPWQRDTVSMSFSTTKGVVSTVLHRLADRGLVDYGEPVARYWPAFGAAGKQQLTVEQLLSHAGGLHGLRDLVDHPDDLLDHRDMAARLAASAPSPPPGTGCGYHGLTFGWLVAGLIEAVTGDDVRDVLARELADPLEVDGLYFGAPPAHRHRAAHLFPDMLRVGGAIQGIVDRVANLNGMHRFAEAFHIPGIEHVLFDEDRIHHAPLPSVNGMFTARALARMYGALANGGVVDGVELLSPRTVHTIGRVRRRDRDYILKIPMRWRLGYHQAFVVGRLPRKAFGHFGFGGSGAWADPETGLSIAFVTNRLGTATTPLGDLRLPTLGRHALTAARRVNERRPRRRVRPATS